MKIFLLRHGESEANIANVINDDPKHAVNLTERGRAQASNAANLLRGIRFTQAYASEFPRAQQTAELILRHQDCALQIDSRLNERRSGMDGQPVGVFNDLVRSDLLHFKPERGESFMEQMQRVRSVLDALATRHAEGIVLAVSHENPILAARALSAGDPEQIARGSIANCEWIELNWPEERR
jgi:broad specificity phosphatase PhoE